MLSRAAFDFSSMPTPRNPSALGLESGTVRVVSYDARWPALYLEEEARIRRALSGLPLVLEHVGSTSVTGLAAKPIIDIIAGRDAAIPASAFVPALESVGYEHRGENGLPGREFFRRGQPRSYHIHLVNIDSALWRHHIAFRDRLRANPTLAAEYASLKIALAERFPRDREAYMDGKDGFIRNAIADVWTPGQ